MSAKVLWSMEGSAFNSPVAGPSLTTLSVHGSDMRICVVFAIHSPPPQPGPEQGTSRLERVRLHGGEPTGGGAVTGPGLIHGDSVGLKAQGALAETCFFPSNPTLAGPLTLLVRI